MVAALCRHQQTSHPKTDRMTTMDPNIIFAVLATAWLFYIIGYNGGESTAKRRAYLEKKHPDMYDDF